MPGRWRLIVETLPGDGAWNMALDRAIQMSRVAGEAPATLRIYGWKRPTVTLGRFQDTGSVDLEACRRYGVDVVRRFTGGRGVLHADEVTYSVVAAVGDGVPRGTAASYAHLCAALVEAYRRLGLAEASLTPRPRGSSASGACYLHATSADLSVGIRKLSGSAQVWMGDAVLQHGSLVMTRDTAREAEVFGLSPAEGEALQESTATLADCLAQMVST
ncbi:MAG: biotin/lipoate A/B protein ligase family protein, partial [Actinomycetota bacterium]|nr:biotin/lipoate A/B protein ligase family protein [Actinomycetota bacterium]